MFSLKDVGLIIQSNGKDIPIYHTRDGHYGPLYAVVDRRQVENHGHRSRGLNPKLAIDYPR